MVAPMGMWNQRMGLGRFKTLAPTPRVTNDQHPSMWPGARISRAASPHTGTDPMARSGSGCGSAGDYEVADPWRRCVTRLLVVFLGRQSITSYYSSLAG